MLLPVVALGFRSVDIAVASNLPLTNPSPVTLGNEGRGTFVHEYGSFWTTLEQSLKFEKATTAREVGGC